MMLVLIPALFLVPYLIGLSFQLVVVVPLRVGLDQVKFFLKLVIKVIKTVNKVENVVEKVFFYYKRKI